MDIDGENGSSNAKSDNYANPSDNFDRSHGDSYDADYSQPSLADAAQEGHDRKRRHEDDGNPGASSPKRQNLGSYPLAEINIMVEVADVGGKRYKFYDRRLEDKLSDIGTFFDVIKKKLDKLKANPPTVTEAHLEKVKDMNLDNQVFIDDKDMIVNDGNTLRISLKRLMKDRIKMTTWKMVRRTEVPDHQQDLLETQLTIPKERSEGEIQKEDEEVARNNRDYKASEHDLDDEALATYQDSFEIV